jgi:precorrin-6A synthase
MRVHIIGIGMGPHHVTPEAADALRAADYVVAGQKRNGDALFAVRREIADAYGVAVVAVPDPERDEGAGDGGYVGAVADWHAARVAAYEAVLAERQGTAAFLVWGDPSFYDSTIRVIEAIAERGEVEVEYDVVPGISALHDVGQPLHVTTGRLLAKAVAAGQTNIVVMLNRSIQVDGLDDWTIWWGGNLGRPEEELVAGRIADVRDEVDAARERIRDSVGWVLDIFVVRAWRVS